jgi:hypothetical protein
MVNSIYFGILQGYLPYAGEFEIITYTGCVIFGKFSDDCRSAVKANPRMFAHLLNRHVKIVFDQENRCISVTDNTHASEQPDKKVCE